MRIVLGDITKMDTDAIVNAAVSVSPPVPEYAAQSLPQRIRRS